MSDIKTLRGEIIHTTDPVAIYGLSALKGYIQDV